MKASVVNPLDIIALQHIEGCGPASTRRICEYLHTHNLKIATPSDLVDLWPEMTSLKVVKGKLTELSEDDIVNAYNKAERILSESEKLGIGVMTFYDEKYPEILKGTINEKDKTDAPILLFYKGDLSALDMPTIAIIGTREPTDEGVMAGRYFGKVFAEHGFNVVSGLALGCDTCGHKGALDAKGVTTAFLAHGLDTIYPPQNKQLAEEIINNGGLLLSEYPIGTPVSKYSLVDRDRLQSGLSLATLVIQTGEKGGTMHAAHTTLLAGKPLYAVMYKDMTMPEVQGNIKLQREGGKFISSADVNEVIKALQDASTSKEEQNYSVEQLTLFSDFE